MINFDLQSTSYGITDVYRQRPYRINANQFYKTLRTGLPRTLQKNTETKVPASYSAIRRRARIPGGKHGYPKNHGG